MIKPRATIKRDWTGLDWTGLDWTGLDWTEIKLNEKIAR
jgi:hypothetical protein